MKLYPVHLVPSAAGDHKKRAGERVHFNIVEKKWWREEDVRLESEPLGERFLSLVGPI